MITYRMVKMALQAYSDEVKLFISQQSLLSGFYELFFVEEKEILENPDFLANLNQLITHSEKKPEDSLSDNELFALFNFLIEYHDFADGKVLINAFDKTIGGTIDDSTPTSMSLMLDVMLTCKKAQLFNLANVSKLAAIFNLKNELSSFRILLLRFSDSPLLNQANLDALISLGRYSINAYFYEMEKAGLLTGEKAQANFDRLISNASKFADDGISFMYLNDRKLLTQASFERLVACPYPRFVEFLYWAGIRSLLTQANLDLFLDDPALALEALAWKDYYRSTLLDQQKLESLIAGFYERQQQAHEPESDDVQEEFSLTASETSSEGEVDASIGSPVTLFGKVGGEEKDSDTAHLGTGAKI